MNLFIKEKEIEKIVLEHLLRIRKIEESSCTLIRQQIHQLTSRVLLSINQSLKNVDHSKKYECLYYLMIDSKKLYKNYMDLVEDVSMHISDEKTRDILVGIGDIAKSSILDIKEEDDNPIAYERMVMISAGILKIKKVIIEDIDYEYAQCNIGNHISKSELIEYMNKHVMNFFERILPRIHEIIEETIGTLAMREAALPYLTQMMAQKTSLESLVMVQIDIVEEGLEDKAEGELVNRMLGILREIYQRTLTVENKIKVIKNEQVTAKEIIDYETIKGIVEDNLLTRSKEVLKILEAVEDNRQDSLAELLTLVVDELGALTYQTVNEIKLASSPYQILSCQILELFGRAVDKLALVEADYTTIEGGKISQGILDTMRLKHESLKEKDTEFQMGKKDLSIIEEKKLYDLRLVFESDAENILKEAIDGSNEGFLSIQEKFKKRVEAIKLNHFKQDMAYLRNELLFEIRTFDEMVSHSLNKLVEYEGETSKAMTEIMKYVYNESRRLINKSGILFIEPDPHEKFDGKLHEIMMAEVDASYTKGEVIKCQGIGYIRDDYIIMRANVVAAK